MWEFLAHGYKDRNSSGLSLTLHQILKLPSIISLFLLSKKTSVLKIDFNFVDQVNSPFQTFYFLINFIQNTPTPTTKTISITASHQHCACLMDRTRATWGKLDLKREDKPHHHRPSSTFIGVHSISRMMKLLDVNNWRLALRTIC